MILNFVTTQSIPDNLLTDNAKAFFRKEHILQVNYFEASEYAGGVKEPFFRLLIECPLCTLISNIDVFVTEFQRYVESFELIQNAMPGRSDNFRELFKTGVDKHCWESLYDDGYPLT